MKARKSIGHSHRTIADLLGICKSEYTHYENGNRNPRAEVIMKLETLFPNHKLKDLLEVMEVAENE